MNIVRVLRARLVATHDVQVAQEFGLLRVVRGVAFRVRSAGFKDPKGEGKSSFDVR